MDRANNVEGANEPENNELTTPAFPEIPTIGGPDEVLDFLDQKGACQAAIRWYSEQMVYEEGIPKGPSFIEAFDKLADNSDEWVKWVLTALKLMPGCTCGGGNKEPCALGEWETANNEKSAAQLIAENRVKVAELYNRWVETECATFDVKYVNAYSVTRHYGGPEEGGWWYDAGEPLASVPVRVPRFGKDCRDEDPVLKARYELGQLLEPQFRGNRDRHSVIGDANLVIAVEDSFAQPYPKQTPHYE